VEDTPSLGGFAVPDEMAAQILDRALESEVVRPRAQVWKMNSETLKVPGLDNFDHSSSLYGGFTATWVTEATTLTPQTNKLYQVGLIANALKILGQVSNELLADAVSGYENAYQASLTAAVSWFHDFAFLRGSGAGQPKGVLNDSALVVVSKESAPAQGAGTIVYENITKMFARLHPACLSNSIWVCNSTAIPQLLAMQNKVWNNAHSDVVGGSAVPVVSQNADGSFTMLTRPLLFTEKLPALGTQGDILLADFSQYAVGQRQGMGIEKSIHAGFASDTSYYRVVTRLDGQGTWKSSVTPKAGDSLSWAVVVEGR
jgi:HK97 family phage major capsid protein